MKSNLHSKSASIQIGAYYFPNYHRDPRNEDKHGKNWTEWEVLKNAGPRFEGHQQPKIPLWGYEDESIPSVMEKKIKAAVDHGLDYWIWDWYYYEDGMFLNKALEEGYFQSHNKEQLPFSIMWANHDWIDIMPAKYSKKSLLESSPIDFYGHLTPFGFDQMTDYLVKEYFSKPYYWKIDGRPFFSIYDLSKLIKCFGTTAETRKALGAFRDKVKKAGFPDLHLSAVVWGKPILPTERIPLNPEIVVQELGFDSFTSYVWIHHGEMKEFPQTSYEGLKGDYFSYWDEAEKRMTVPYIPNVTMGWDSSPRTVQSDIFENLGYPFIPTLKGNSPEAFQKAVSETLRRLQGPGNHLPTCNINAWNEWTEGSYLEPDLENGWGYLEAIKKAKLGIQEL